MLQGTVGAADARVLQALRGVADIDTEEGQELVRDLDALPKMAWLRRLHFANGNLVDFLFIFFPRNHGKRGRQRSNDQNSTGKTQSKVQKEIYNVNKFQLFNYFSNQKHGRHDHGRCLHLLTNSLEQPYSPNDFNIR